jgi:hypothetical protein
MSIEGKLDTLDHQMEEEEIWPLSQRMWEQYIQWVLWSVTLIPQITLQD